RTPSKGARRVARATRSILDARSRRRRRPHDGAAGRGGADRHVHGDLRARADHPRGAGAIMSVESRHSPERFINRELSWLAFNERVLEEAADPTNPLLERVKFAAIVGSNLDEFFMVRVASLRHAVADGDATPDPSGLTPSEQLAAI